MNLKTRLVIWTIILAIATIVIIIRPIDIHAENNSGDSINNRVSISKLNRDKVGYENKTLIHIIQKNYIQHPSTLPYNISRPWIINPSPGQTQFIDNYLEQMTNGFFIDCGAFDGEHLSNSLFLERYRNWTGILIEPNPDIYKSLKSKHRKAYSLNSCLSTNKFPSIETFFVDDIPVRGKVLDVRNDSVTGAGKFVHVQCFPLYSILLAIGRFEVDYFSLDVEGAERGVLDTIPWDKINVKMISIEHNKWPGGKQNLKHYMEARGYKTVTEIKVGVAPDLIFWRSTSV